MEWRELFKPNILRGAQDYITSDSIKKYEDSNGHISAIIEGIETFYVDIDYDVEIKNIRCSCPYAKAGNNCKHMAAALLKREAEQASEDVSKVNEETKSGAKSEDKEETTEEAKEDNPIQSPEDTSEPEDNKPDSKDAVLSKSENTDISMRYDGRGNEIDIIVGKMDVFNYALYQNNIEPIREIQVLNKTENTLTGLTIRITSDFHFFKKYEFELPPILPGKPIAIPDPHLMINGNMLAGMTEAINIDIMVEICRDSESICIYRNQIKVLAYDQWQGEGYINYLPAFVMPNHPVISMLLHNASEWLKRENKLSAIDDYQSGNPNRVIELAAAAYAAIQKKNITYATAPANLWENGQRIRTPEVILDQHLGNCMDMTLLYAACLEAMGLNPFLYLIKGHIFAGLWLAHKSFDDVCVKNHNEIIMRMAKGTEEVILIECTKMCSGVNCDFDDAVYGVDDDNMSEQVFDCVIDVFTARIAEIKPVPSRSKAVGEFTINIPDLDDKDVTSAPKERDIVISEIVESAPRKVTNKRELWESKLLDLSTNNMLLNLRLNASVEPIMSSHIDELEDALADGHEFQLYPCPPWEIFDILPVTVNDGKKDKEISFRQFLNLVRNEPMVFEYHSWTNIAGYDLNEKFRQEYRNHRLYTFSTEKQLDCELTTIYRVSRSSQQENGVSSLYLAIGLLRWFVESDSKEPCYAPLILIPIEIVRKSANQGYALHSRADDPHFNTTLLEMLKQNFNLNIGGLDPLPTDEHGIDIKKVFAIVRNSLFTVKNWDVVETCVIGNFSFDKFAMWNDIHTAESMLDESKVVRSLMKGHVDWDVRTAEELQNEHTYLPITVDDTQLKAINMAVHGTTFVLHGPPGTGKSQTITGMIANLMAQGKTVLFVAEKMPALSVVQKRLASLGIGDFCLELYSDKANKKHVLSQLDRVLAIKKPSEKTEYTEYYQKTVASREKLDDYAKHLHEVHECGYSLRELIDLYETVRDSQEFARFNQEEVANLSREQIKSHLPLIGQLIAAGDMVGKVAGNPLMGIQLASYSAEVRESVRRIVEDYIDAINRVQENSRNAAEILKVDAPNSKTELDALCELLNLYESNKGIEPLLVSLLENDSSMAYAYFAHAKSVDDEKTLLISIWKDSFLTMDMSAFLAKHEAASKKMIFTRNSAMNAVTSEVQAFARLNISYEQIPRLLGQVSQYQEHEESLKQEFANLPTAMQTLIKQLPTEEVYSKAYDEAMQCKQRAEAFPGGLEAILTLASKSESEQAFAEFKTDLQHFEDAETTVNTLLQRKSASTSDNWFESEKEFCHYLIRHTAELKDLALYNQVRQRCINVGLLPVIEAYEAGMSSEILEKAYKKGIYYALINSVIWRDDVLSCFSGATFNQSIQHFKKLDDMMLDLTKREIYLKLVSNIPGVWDSPEIGKELSLLRKAIGSNARGMSIRILFERISHILPKLSPCILMSPNSVAQYLAQDSNLFDVVIFDEASQLPTCKAVGALARAKDAVIVGDPKQMPPTTFFAGSGPEMDDLALDDLDSILDDALALGIPSQYLQWHYRSTHESLIAFSNNKFYDNKMYTFPSANDRERHVTAVHVDGVYTKTKNTNVKEAEAVVAEIVRRFLDPELKKQSIGVVTFNVKQQTLIENLLAKQFQNNPEMDLWANSGEDLLFVKNLESVQGDERDVILFSIGYGPDEKGHISMNFGPINKAGGGKRLNVAFSRSRVTMTIFASLYSTDIKVTDNSPDGLRAFRDFLAFAEGKGLPNETDSEVEEKLSRAGILQSICKAITDHGYQCETMVGHSDFHVDIAVIDPCEPDKYILGILLDGDTYRQTNNTRDREVAQISVLSHLGWKLRRIWTIDWWDKRDSVLEKLIAQLDELKAESEKQFAEKQAAEEARKAEEAEREAEAARIKEELESQVAEVVDDEEEEKEDRTLEKPVIDDVEKNEEHQQEDNQQDDSANEQKSDEKCEQKSDETENKDIAQNQSKIAGTSNESTEDKIQVIDKSSIPTEYVSAELPNTPMGMIDFAIPGNQKEIADRMTAVLNVEAPIPKDALYRMIWSSFGVSRSAVILDATDKAFKSLKVKTTKQKGVIFCWAKDQDPKEYAGIRVSNSRSGDAICQQEIKNAACYVLKTKGDLNKDDLIKEISRLFGYKRLGKNLEASLAVGVQFARTSKAIVQKSNGKLGLAE